MKKTERHLLIQQNDSKMKNCRLKEIQDQLEAKGAVTQEATLSRDLHCDLGLVKVKHERQIVL